jgi:hypothetical protein
LTTTEADKKKTESHHRGYKIETKQHLEHHIHPQLATHPVVPTDETYIVDLTGDYVIDLTRDGDDGSEINAKEKAEKASKPPDPGNAIRKKNTPGTSTNVRPTSRKRKFCETMSRCIMCCFSIKRRRINATIDEPNSAPRS